jgi:hypothetical protein
MRSNPFLSNQRPNEHEYSYITLLEKVLDTDLEEDMKSFMLGKLRDIEQAIINYKFQGSKGLSQVVDSTFGALIQNEKLRPQKENPTVY